MSDPDDEHSKASAANPPQVRSRITVVCAECKRLKLKCDRRTPCGSCVKRDTVARCVYSPAAAEKVDLHSLNNRLIQVEQLLAQGNNAVVAQPTAAPGPPVPLTPLAIPLADLHTACLAPLGLPTPPIPPRTRPESSRSRPSSRITAIPSLAPNSALLQLIPSAQRLPARLAAAHAALTAIAAAPFPFSWFETRAYGFISALAAAPDGGSTPTTSNATKPAKDARKRDREEKRERARTIFSGGSNGSHNFTNFSGYTALLNGSGTNNSPAPYPGSFGYGGSTYDAFSDVPPVHSLTEPESDPTDPDTLDNSEAEVDELDNENGDPDAITLRPAGAHPSNSAVPTSKQLRGDPRIAFFALLCGVLALSANSAEASDDLPEVDLLALSKRATAEYFAPPPSAVVADGSTKDKEKKRLQAEADAVLAMWAVSVCMMRRPGPPGEEVYVHLAQTVVQARIAGLDREAAQRLPPEAKAQLAAKTIAGKRQKQRHVVEPPVIKMEDVEECLGVAGPKQKEECVHMLRARTWWAVCWADILASESVDLAPAVALGTALQHQPTTLNGVDPDLLEPAVDWSEDGDAATCFDGKRFGTWARFARVLHHVHTLTGMEGACSAEVIIRAWASAEGGGDLMGNIGLMSPVSSPSIQTHIPAFVYGGAPSDGMDIDSNSPTSASQCSISENRPMEGNQHRSEVALMANRAVLKVWLSWMAFNPSVTASPRTCPSTLPMQAVYGAVGAAHGIVQACRSLQSIPLEAQMPSLGLLVDPPTRAIFDAGIVCAHAALRYPIAVFAAGAREALSAALGLFRNRPGPGHVEGVHVLEGLARRAGVLEESYNLRGSPELSSKITPSSTLKRKHDAALGPGQAIMDPSTPPKPNNKHAQDLALRESEMLRDKELQSKDKNSKKRPSYPSVGIRIRPGKEVPFFASGSASASPIVPAAPRKGSAGTNSSPGSQQDEMYYPLSQQPKTGPSSSSAQSQTMMDAYRSRSSSISQDPRMQPPKDQQQLAMEFSVPFSTGTASSSQPLEDFSRRSFGELPPSTSQQQHAMYDLQPPRAGSFEADTYGTVESPFGNSSGSGSPYATPSFGNPSGRHPSPPSYSTQQPYYSNGYDAPSQQPQPQYQPPPPSGYDMKPQQYHNHNHVEQDSHPHSARHGHDMVAAWATAAAPPDSHSQFWTATGSDEGYKFYSQ